MKEPEANYDGRMVPRQALPESGGFLEEICVVPGLRLAQGCYFRLTRVARSRSTPGKGSFTIVPWPSRPRAGTISRWTTRKEMREEKTDPGGVLELNFPKDRAASASSPA